jgi:hypothetical protein
MEPPPISDRRKADALPSHRRITSPKANDSLKETSKASFIDAKKYRKNKRFQWLSLKNPRIFRIFLSSAGKGQKP